MSMTVQQIIDEIQEKYPNSLTAVSPYDSVVKKMDRLQKRLYREMKIRTSTQYDTLANTSLYPIPLIQDQIFKVLIDGTEYEYKDIEDYATSSDKYYYFIESSIGLYPTPTVAGTMLIYHYQVPTTLVSTNLNAVPDLDGDYHEIFVYHIASQIAEGYRDFDISNGFIVRYNEIENDLMSHFLDPEIKKIHSVSGW